MIRLYFYLNIAVINSKSMDIIGLPFDLCVFFLLIFFSHLRSSAEANDRKWMLNPNCQCHINTCPDIFGPVLESKQLQSNTIKSFECVFF